MKKIKKLDFSAASDNMLLRRLTLYNITNVLSVIFKLMLMIGLSFIILFPFLVKISSAFMSIEDTYDTTVAFIPRHPTLENIRYIVTSQQLEFFKATFNTVLMALMVGVCSAVMAALVGYGLAKFNFKGSKVLTLIVIITLLVPPQTIIIPMYTKFKYFLGGLVSLLNTPLPMFFLAITGLGFRSGLYIMMMRQVFKGIPTELSEAAAVDGVGAFKTFWYIMLPNAKAMLLTVFLFAFSWQWTDMYYTGLFYSKLKLLPYIVTILQSLNITDLGTGVYTRDILVNTLVILAIFPLLILFFFVQKKFVQGIESSGITG